MNCSNLSNFQLYGLIQNVKLDNEIRTLAKNEFESRDLNESIKQDLVQKYDGLFLKKENDSLRLRYKIIAIAFPFWVPLQAIIISKWLSNGNKENWKVYWKYIIIGNVLWTAIVILYGRFLFTQ